MKKTAFTFLIFAFGLMAAQAQRFSIQGVIADSASVPLE